MNEQARPKSLFITVVGVFNIVVGLWWIGHNVYPYVRYTRDEAYRDRLLDEISEAAKQEYRERWGAALFDPTAEIKVDRDKIDAYNRASLWGNMWYGVGLGSALLVVAVGILLRKKWGRILGIILAAFLLVAAIGQMISPEPESPIVKWMVRIPLLLIVVLLNFLALIGRRARACFAKAAASPGPAAGTGEQM